jgi:tRNA (cmo5U34)-methyltransferase
VRRTSTGFDLLAPAYTFLIRKVFGKTLERAQCHFLHYLKPDDHILMLGGGDGTFLKVLLATHPNLRIDYIDISPRMIALAKQKTPTSSTVNFIVGTEENIPNTPYSVVITNFYLDLFSDKTLKTIIEKIKSCMQPKAYWFATDFVHEKWWHGLMLWLMYRFFRITTGIEAKRLPKWQHHLTDTHEKEIVAEKFYHGFVLTSVYTR